MTTSDQADVGVVRLTSLEAIASRNPLRVSPTFADPYGSHGSWICFLCAKVFHIKVDEQQSPTAFNLNEPGLVDRLLNTAIGAPFPRFLNSNRSSVGVGV